MSDWDSFVEECRKDVKPVGARCTVGLMLNGLSKAARAAVTDAIADPGLSARAIVTALRGRGQDAPSVWAVRNHRRGDCRCRDRETTT